MKGWKALLVLQGEGALVGEEERRSICSGQVAVFSEGYRFHWVKQGQEQQVRLPLESLKKYSTPHTDLTSLLGQNGNVLSLSSQEQGELSDLLTRGEQAKEFLGFGGDLHEELALIQIVLHLTPLFLERQGECTSTLSVNQRIAPILKFMEENAAEPLSLDELSARFYVSKHYLCRLFKEQTGVTVVEYLVQCRMEKACRLLEQGHSVQRAGELSGFSDNSHFIRTFGSRMGTSPGRYAKGFRQRAQGNHKEESEYESKKE